MKKVEILGTGCAKCKKLYELTLKAVEDNGLDVEVAKVEDIKTIVDKGVMMTPGFLVDGEIKSVGKSLSVDQILKLLS